MDSTQQTTNGTASNHQTTTNPSEQPDGPPPPRVRNKPRKLTMTDKLIEMRDQHARALTKLKEREAALSLELDRIRSSRAEQEDALRRVNATLPADQRAQVDELGASRFHSEASADQVER